MGVKPRSTPNRGAVVALAAGLALAGCGSETGKGVPASQAPAATTSGSTSPNPGSSLSTPVSDSVGSLDELFEAVDERLDCPGPSDGFFGEDHYFMVGGGAQLVGRLCGETMVMAWSDDPSMIQGARELLSSSVAPVPVVGTAEWFVADMTEAREGGTGVPKHQAASKDLGRIAADLGAVGSNRVIP
ncbi:hypothetical protein GCM10025784_06820 [Citricoccus nitrophenolicus]